jgi:hypothetical protein
MKTRAYVYYGNDDLIWSSIYSQPNTDDKWPEVNAPLTLFGEYDSLNEAKEAVYKEQQSYKSR